MSTGGKKKGELIEHGTAVVTSNNARVTINYLISDSGGQGDVYHVTFRDHDYALKWYCKHPEDVIGSLQYQTISKICGEDKKPSDKFIWPLILVTEEEPSDGKKFGYLMELLPKGYFEMDAFLRMDNDARAVRFKNYNASRIVCVGGSSNMPQVIGGLQKAFPSKELPVFEPEKSIAIGAAIYAQFCDGKDTFLSDIASFSYGIRCYSNSGVEADDKLIVVNLIQRGDRLPETGKHSFLTREDNQSKVAFRVFESSKAVKEYDFVEGSSSIMEVVLEIPPNQPKGTSVAAYMTLTPDGIIEVMADDDNGHKIKAQKQLNF